MCKGVHFYAFYFLCPLNYQIYDKLLVQKENRDGMLVISYDYTYIVNFTYVSWEIFAELVGRNELIMLKLVFSLCASKNWNWMLSQSKTKKNYDMVKTLHTHGRADIVLKVYYLANIPGRCNLSISKTRL